MQCRTAGVGQLGRAVLLPETSTAGTYSDADALFGDAAYMSAPACPCCPRWPRLTCLPAASHAQFIRSCVGVWQHDRVEIIPNEQGNRTTPSYVAFTDTERLIGDAAKNQVAMNPTNTVFDAKRLIGRRFSDPAVKVRQGGPTGLAFLKLHESLWVAHNSCCSGPTVLCASGNRPLRSAPLHSAPVSAQLSEPAPL